jgi:ubiquinone/menaquinone biosynthesis C-methylase UbiE
MEPNHHHDHPPFAGMTGLIAGLSMVAGRDDQARAAVDLSELRPEDHLVDIGCGPGSITRYAARQGATVTGIDPAPVMLRLARWLSPRTTGVHYVEGSAESLPVADAEATVVWSIATVHHWADVVAGLAEVRRVLAPCGRFVAIERRTSQGAKGHASHGWTSEQADVFAEACTAHGFEGVSVETPTGRRALLAVVGRVPSHPESTPPPGV